MKLEIVPYHDDAYDCEEDLIASAARWFGQDYELMFSESWGFSFSPGDGDSNSFIGNGIQFKKSTTWLLLERYHGINVSLQPMNDFSKALELIEEELSANRPVLLNIDGFWCNWWDGAYQKFHLPHSCLIVSADDIDRGFLCIDGYPVSYGDYLSKEEFKQGCYELITFKLNGEDRRPFDLKEIFNNTHQRLYSADNGINVFDSIRKLGEQINNLKDLKMEVAGCEENLPHAPLFKNLLSISRGCRQFARALKYIGSRAEADTAKLLELSEQLELAGLRWAEIQAVLIKAYYLPNPQRLISRAVEKILNSAADEERIAEGLFKLC